VYDWTKVFAVNNANTREELEKISEENKIDSLSEIADKALDMTGEALNTGANEYIFKPIGEAIKYVYEGIIDFLNLHSTDIITMGIVLGGVCMIIVPLLGGNAGKWLGRVLFIGTVGSLWRLAI
jgi:hypothetical protein